MATRLKIKTTFLSDGADKAFGVATDLSGMVRDGSKLGAKIFGNAKKKSRAMVGKTGKEANNSSVAEMEFGEEVGDAVDNPVQGARSMDQMLNGSTATVRLISGCMQAVACLLRSAPLYSEPRI